MTRYKLLAFISCGLQFEHTIHVCLIISCGVERLLWCPLRRGCGADSMAFHFTLLAAGATGGCGHVGIRSGILDDFEAWAMRRGGHLVVLGGTSIWMDATRNGGGIGGTKGSVGRHSRRNRSSMVRVVFDGGTSFAGDFGTGTFGVRTFIGSETGVFGFAAGTFGVATGTFGGETGTVDETSFVGRTGSFGEWWTSSVRAVLLFRRHCPTGCLSPSASASRMAEFV